MCQLRPTHPLPGTFITSVCPFPESWLFKQHNPAPSGVASIELDVKQREINTPSSYSFEHWMHHGSQYIISRVETWQTVSPHLLTWRTETGPITPGHTHPVFPELALDSCLSTLKSPSLTGRWKLTTRWHKQDAFDGFSASDNRIDLQHGTYVTLTRLERRSMKCLQSAVMAFRADNSSLVIHAGTLNENVNLPASFWQV